jgi:chromosome partitioning protein
MSAKIIAFANQKGGVAKTTSTYNVGVSLAQHSRVLLLDLDPQASLTICAGLEPYDYENNIVTLLQGTQTPETCIQPVKPNLSIITSSIALAGLEIALTARTMRELILKKALKQIQNDFDYILIDCPPQLSILTINALSAANYVIIPSKTDYLSYRGIEQLLDTISVTQQECNDSLQILGVIATMHEEKIRDSREVLSELQENYTVLAVTKKLSIVNKGLYEGLAVTEQAASNPIAIAYDKVAEIIVRKSEVA